MSAKLDFVKSYKGKKVLVTGHTGFKGSWLAEWLLTLGAEVSGFSIDVPTEPSHFEAIGLGKRMKDYRGDICDLPAMLKVFCDVKPEIVFHLAAQPIVRASYDDPKRTFDVNVGGTVNFLECVRDSASVKATVIITTDKCYENTGKAEPYIETDPLGGSDPYSASKAGAEIVFSSYARSFLTDKKAASARAGNVIGGGDWAQDRIVADCVRAWSRKEKVLLRNPDSVRPWQHVLEPVGAYLVLGARLLEQPEGVHREAFNFGPTAEANFRTIDLVREVEKHWPAANHSLAPQNHDGKKEAKLLRLNIEKASRILGWHPQLQFSECAAWLVDWYRAYYEKPASCLELTRKQIHDYQARLQKSFS